MVEASHKQLYECKPYHVGWLIFTLFQPRSKVGIKVSQPNVTVFGARGKAER